MWYDQLLISNQIPDFLIRLGIRKKLKQRLDEENQGDAEYQKLHLLNFVQELKTFPIAVNNAETIEQPYEVPTMFYRYCLGKNLKFSSGFWKESVTDITTSENDMLELTCERAELINGQKILELGSGWGSLSLFMSEKYPESSFTIVSNSIKEKEYIDQQAIDRKLTNLNVILADINTFQIDEQFDRIVSIEMFQRMRNYQLLLKKLASFLKDDGKLFVQIFTHKEYTYLFEVKDENDWMTKYFFSGIIMPNNDLLLHFNEDLQIEKQWLINGTHYAKTSEAWISNMDAHKAEIMPLFEETYGKDQALKWWVYWRIFFMSFAELWNYNEGNEWMVSHYLFNKTY